MQLACYLAYEFQALSMIATSQAVTDPIKLTISNQPKSVRVADQITVCPVVSGRKGPPLKGALRRVHFFSGQGGTFEPPCWNFSALLRRGHPQLRCKCKGALRPLHRPLYITLYIARQRSKPCTCISALLHLLFPLPPAHDGKGYHHARGGDRNAAPGPQRICAAQRNAGCRSQ